MENREKIVDLSPRSRFSKWIGSSVSVHRRIESRQAYAPHIPSTQSTHCRLSMAGLLLQQRWAAGIVKLPVSLTHTDE